MSELAYEDDVLNDEVPQEDVSAAFVVDSDQKAEWCIHKIAEVEAETERWRRFYAERTKAVEDSNMFRIARLKQLLIPYMQKVPLKETKTKKKYGLPSGDLVITKEHTRIEHDDSILLDWVLKNDESFVRVKKSVDWRSLKDKLAKVGDDYVLEETGEIVPGVHDVIVPAEFEVKPKGAVTT